jgi:hypothetical protein
MLRRLLGITLGYVLVLAFIVPLLVIAALFSLADELAPVEPDPH